MSWISKALNMLGIRTTTGLGLPYPEWQFIGGMWVMMKDDPRNYITDGYKGNAYMHAIVSNIVDKASDAPGQVYRIRDDNKAKAFQSLNKSVSWQKSVTLKALAFEEITDHPFSQVMRNPNPLMTEKQLKREMLGYYLITGNSYLYVATPGIGLNMNVPKELWVIPSPCVEIVMGTRRDPVAGYRVGYYGPDIIAPEKVVHMKSFNPVYDVFGQQWLYGMSPMQAGRAALGQFEAGQIAQGTLFKNLGPAGIISGMKDTQITEEQAIAIQDKFRQMHTGLVRGGGMVITPAQLQYTQIGMSSVDLNIVAAKGDLLQEICAVYNYPKEKITGSSNTASQGVSDRQVITSCVMPLLRDFDDVMTKFIRKAYKDDSLVYISDTQYFPELQTDRKDLAAWLSQAWWTTVNEKRRVMDYEAIEGGDVMLVPSGLSTIDDVTAPADNPDIDLLNENNANDYGQV